MHWDGSFSSRHTRVESVASDSTTVDSVVLSDADTCELPMLGAAMSSTDVNKK